MALFVKNVNLVKFIKLCYCRIYYKQKCYKGIESKLYKDKCLILVTYVTIVTYMLQ